MPTIPYSEKARRLHPTLECFKLEINEYFDESSKQTHINFLMWIHGRKPAEIYLGTGRTKAEAWRRLKKDWEEKNK